MFFWFVMSMYSGTGYPSSIFTRMGTGMGELFYPCTGTGNLAGKILSHGYGYGIAIPDEYIPVAIFTPTWFFTAGEDTKIMHEGGGHGGRERGARTASRASRTGSVASFFCF
jgi:hypothetical protein